MLYLLLSLSNVLLALIALSIYRGAKGDSRAAERRENALVTLVREQNDQMMHLVGRTWTIPERGMPMDKEETEEEKEERVKREQGWVSL